MLQVLKNKLKNAKGFTLIELLAVIVILGIIAAIAVPSIMSIINNSKIDAHISNAQQMANSAKLYINEQKSTISTDSANPTKVTLDAMVKDGLMDYIKDPSASSASYSPTASYVNVSKDSTSGKVTYSVFLTAANGTTAYANGKNKAGDIVDAFSLQRADITNP